MYENDKKHEYSDTSMEDILSSIRKYVSDESDDGVYEDIDNNIINLDERHLSPDRDMRGGDYSYDGNNENRYEDKYDKGGRSIFGKFASAVKKTRSSKVTSKDIAEMTISQFLNIVASEIVLEWCDKNLRRIVEEIVVEEIEKIKSE